MVSTNMYWFDNFWLKDCSPNSCEIMQPENGQDTSHYNLSFNSITSDITFI